MVSLILAGVIGAGIGYSLGLIIILRLDKWVYKKMTEWVEKEQKRVR